MVIHRFIHLSFTTKCFVVPWDPDIRQLLILILPHSFITSPIFSTPSGCYINHHPPTFLCCTYSLRCKIHLTPFCIHHINLYCLISLLRLQVTLKIDSVCTKGTYFYKASLMQSILVLHSPSSWSQVYYSEVR